MPFVEGLTWAATLLSLAAGLGAAGHAVVYKRDPRSATLWVLLIALLPLGGAALYLLFGINRYQRRARRRFRSMGAVWSAENRSDGYSLPPEWRGLAQLVGRATGLPLTAGNHVRPLFDGAEAYPAMLAAIGSARHSVVLASYLFDGSEIGLAFVDALTRAHRRGVRVRVLIDDVAVRLSRHGAYPALKRAGVPVAVFNRSWIPARLHAAHLRNHRKLLVIDGTVGFTGGMNVQAPYWRPEAPALAYRDLHFRIDGPVVAHLAETFVHDWCDTTGELLSSEFFGGAPAAGDGSGTCLARGIEAGPDETIDRLRWVFMGALSVARRSVRIWTPYFVPDQALIVALSTAALRGVAVDVLTPEHGDHPFVQWAARAQYWQVLEHGVRIHERPGPFDHRKLLLVDGTWCCLGSANWDARSLRLNFEFNVEVYDAPLVAGLEAAFDRARQEARTISPESLLAQPLATRVRNGVARLFAPVL